MFTMLPKGRGVVSAEGFCVQRFGSPMTQFVVHYSEGDHILEYPLENLVPGVIDMVFVDRIGPWCSPYQTETIDDERKLLIAVRIRDAMGFLGDVIEVIEEKGLKN